ncbi:MAG: hypothetical protein OXI55_12150 [Gammaproteobacteria bacterium]|nr:hypothetical protein [Gammaproteobacteria bacterium]
MKLLKIVAHSLVGILVVVVLGLIVTKFFDGPIGPLPGGALRSGEIVTAAVDDWSFVTDVELIELQLVAENQSRTVGIVFNDGTAYVSSTPATYWQRKVETSADAWLRIEGRRYPVALSRIHEPARNAAIRTVATAKYAEAITPDFFFFRVESRSHDA